MLLDRISDSGRHHRDLAERLFMAPTMSFSSLKATPSSYKSSFNTDVSDSITVIVKITAETGAIHVPDNLATGSPYYDIVITRGGKSEKLRER